MDLIIGDYTFLCEEVESSSHDKEFLLCQKCKENDNKKFLINDNCVILDNFGNDTDSFSNSMQKIRSEYFTFTRYIEDYEDDKSRNIPYDPKQISYLLKPYLARNIYDFVTGYDGTEMPSIDLNPDFQRNKIWTIAERSRFIESILLNLPVPAVYLNQTKDETYVVADGLQRLSAIVDFMKNEYPLRKLEYFTELEGCYYKESIEENNQKKYINIGNANRIRIRDYTISAYVIANSTPDKVKLDLFKRINSGGVKLNGQELRNSMMTKNVRDLIFKFANGENFKKFSNLNLVEKRMQNIEYIIRYLSFKTLEDKKNGVFDRLEINFNVLTNSHEFNYYDNASDFMDDFIVILARESELFKYVEEIYLENFDYKIDKIISIMGIYAFRKIEINDSNQILRRNPLNTQLYTVFMLEIEKYIHFTPELTSESATMLFAQYLLGRDDNKEFYFACSSATNNLRNIYISRKYVKFFLEEVFI